MKRFLSYSIIPSEDVDKVKKLGSRLSNLAIDYFMVEKNGQENKFTPIQNKHLLMVFQDLKTDLESIVTLTYFFIRYCNEDKDKSMSSLKELETILYKQLKIIDFNELTTSSIDFEGLFKNLALLLHIGKLGYRDDTWIKALDKNYLSDFIDGTITIGKKKVKAVMPDDKKEGFIDPNEPDVNYIATSVRMYRNFLAHKYLPDENGWLFFVSNDEEDNSTVITAAKLFVSFVILIVRYRYDDILDALSDYIFKTKPSKAPSEEMSEEELESRAIDLLNKEYIPHLEREQQADLKAVYRFTNKTTDEEAKSEILHIRLKSFENALVSEHGQGNDDDNDLKKGLEIENIEILDRAESKIALFGESGSGKTTMLSQLTMELIERWKQSGEDEVCHLPIRVNLTNFGAPASLQSFIRLAVLEGSAIHEKDAEIVWKYVEDLLIQGNAIVLLDGLNEVKGDFNEGWKRICEFMEMYPDCKYIITSRIDDIRMQTHDFEYLSNVGFVIFQLCTLSNEDIKCQLRNVLKVIFGETSSANVWFDSIKGNESLVEMSKNPMQLMLLVNLLENGQEGSLESMNPSRLYDQYIDDMLMYEIVKFEGGRASLYRAARKGFDDVVKLIARMMGAEKKALNPDDIQNEYLKTHNVNSGITFFVASFLEQIETATKMGLLRLDKQGNLEFTHQSWIEFYRSMDYMEEIFEIMKETCLTSEEEEKRLGAIVEEIFSFPYSLRAKYLKALLELMEWREKKNGTATGWDRSAMIKCTFIMMILKYNSEGASDPVVLRRNEDDDRLSVVEGTEMPAIHSSLKLLAFATSTLSYSTPRDKDINDVRHTQYRLPPLYIVEVSILNAMYLYKQRFPSGEIDMTFLPDLFECAAYCGTEKIAKELCTPYWLKMWVFFLAEAQFIVPKDRISMPQEHKTYYPEDNSDCKYLADILTSKFRHPMNLCELIVEEYVFLRCCKMLKTASQILGRLLRLYDRIDDRRLKKEHARLLGLASSNNGYIKYLYNSLAQYALFMMEDPDYISSKFNLDITIDIHRTAMNHLFEMSADESIQKILLKTVDNVEKKKKGQRNPDKLRDSTMRVLRFLLFSYPESNILHEFLWDKSNAYILENNPELVDILPIDKIPENFIKANYDVDIFNMMKLQHQEREDRHHQFNDFRKIYEESLDEGTITEEGYDSFVHLFHPVTEDGIHPNGNIIRNKVAYSILERPNNQTLVLSCEGLISGDKMSKKYCRLEGVEQWFVVDSNSPASGSFVELRFSGFSASLPYRGSIHINAEEERLKLKYCYIIRGDEYFVVRVADTDGVAILERLYTHQDVMNRLEVIIAGQVFKLHEISFYSYPKILNNERAASSLLRIHAINNDSSSNQPVALAGGIPASGYCSLFHFKESDDSPLPLKVNEVSRGKTSLILNPVFWGNNNGNSWFVIGNDQYISRGSYVKMDSKKIISRVNHTAYISRSWEVKFLMDGVIPDFGLISFNDLEKKLHYWVQSVNNKVFCLTVFKIGVDDFDLTSYKDTISSITVGDSEYKISDMSVDAHLPHTYDLLWRMKGEVDYVTGQIVTEEMQLMFYQPVFNSIYTDFQIKEQPLYHINKVKYRYDHLEGHNVLIIPHYISDRDTLFYKLDLNGRCYEVKTVPVSYEEKRKVAIWDIDTIQAPNDVNFKERDMEGFLFFYANPEGTVAEPVGIKYMSSLISENEPQRYHASICTRYLEECKEKGLGSPDIFRFFQIHNRSYEYLQYYLEQSAVWRKNHGVIKPNVGCVVSSNASGVTVFCPSMEGLILKGTHDVIRVNPREYGRKGRVYTENKPQNFALQDIVVCEENHSLSRLNLRDDQRFEMLGYHKGRIYKMFPEGYGYLSSKTIIKDEKNKEMLAFFFVKSQQTLSYAENDIVSFMPSVHLGGHHNGQPIAADVLKIKTLRRNAQITDIDRTTDEDGIERLIIKGTDVETGKCICVHTLANPPEEKEWMVALAKVKVGANVVYIPKRGQAGSDVNAKIIEITNNHE